MSVKTRRIIADIRYKDGRLEVLYTTDYFTGDGEKFIDTKLDTEWTVIFQTEPCS